ncbi:MAG: hypothetical protein OXS47_14610, partial [Chloroflexota bacterium]|nr:hypothetical protein [Chloroflexota bacterium]
MPRRILISNDDGYESPGLWALARACRSLDCDVTVVAPSKNQSAVGGSLTLRQELNWIPIEDPPVGGGGPRARKRPPPPPPQRGRHRRGGRGTPPRR